MGVTAVCLTCLQQNPNSLPRRSREQNAGIFISCFYCWLLHDLPLKRCSCRKLVVMETRECRARNRYTMHFFVRSS